MYIYICIYIYACFDAFITSRLDYCDAVLAGLPSSTLDPLHRVLNAAAHLRVGTATGDLIGDVMRLMHWLPIAYLIRFKQCLLMYAVFATTVPVRPTLWTQHQYIFAYWSPQVPFHHKKPV